VEFKVADAQELPFANDLFDVVMTESVTVFPADKQKAVNEYTRVVKPGGYVALNESTWINNPPPPELLEWAAKDLGANVYPLSESGWKELLEKAGLRDVFVKINRINLQEESGGMLKRYGCGGMLSVMGRMFKL
jgi:ubiquinone/menaquinone biosynthesis C-methylase UbiE